jgi:hypothetical protein
MRKLARCDPKPSPWCPGSDGKQLMPPKKAIRLLGISVSGFDDPESEDEDQLPPMLDGFSVRV